MKQMDDLEAKRERDAEFTGESLYSPKFVDTAPGSNEEVGQTRFARNQRMPVH
jgi:type I restriction enzyme M protein